VSRVTIQNNLKETKILERHEFWSGVKNCKECVRNFRKSATAPREKIYKGKSVILTERVISPPDNKEKVKNLERPEYWSNRPDPPALTNDHALLQHIIFLYQAQCIGSDRRRSPRRQADW